MTRAEIREARKEADAYCQELYAATKEILFWLDRMARFKKWRVQHPEWADELKKAKEKKAAIKAQRTQKL